ncbi:hypothetical protein CEXT_656041 [Caerostris extrusa]|uniref:Uncharacterized protein n=1 Tax=Caerostris extrusa TaxID=172846 RepID=A0AAV4Y4H0_CAEEX|nr:hypothetical protein CEXT_656041 [Caerostris extrusa]
MCVSDYHTEMQNPLQMLISSGGRGRGKGLQHSPEMSSCYNDFWSNIAWEELDIRSINSLNRKTLNVSTGGLGHLQACPTVNACQHIIVISISIRNKIATNEPNSWAKYRTYRIGIILITCERKRAKSFQ